MLEPMRFFSIAGFSALALALWVACGHAQSPPAVSPAHLTFQMVQGRPTPQRFTISIGSGGSAVSWNASVTWPGSNPGLRLSATSGTGPGSVTVTMVDWVVAPLAPGSYSGNVHVQWPRDR